ncbi:MAG: radical SAM protein [Nitrospirae bacterium]|nr:MAG: radical SAM protein [Nitrospirota bacterium]
MQTLAYNDLSGKIRAASVNKRIPLYGMIEVTRRCPLTCVHCYNNLPLTDREAAQNELSLDEHCRILDEITDAGCLWLAYTGGEIFVREDFLEIYAYALKKGLLVTLFTNGLLLTPEIADYLARHRPYGIEITLYGVTRETHERVTGVPGSFDRCMEAVRLLTSRRLPLTLKTMALTINEHELWQIKAFVEEELGLRFRYDPMITPRLDRSRGPLAVRLSPRRVVELDMHDPRIRSEWGKYAESCVSAQRSETQVYYCNAGITGFGIDPYGGLNVCLFSPGGKYDLRTGSFLQGWEGLLRQERIRSISKQTKCTACGIREICGMCPPNSELEEGGPENPVDFFCEVAHLRARALGLSVKPHGKCAYCSSSGNNI